MNMIVAGTSKQSVAALKAHLGREFNMKNMVAVNQKLGMIVHRYRQNE
jgi:hypothetical protein